MEEKHEECGVLAIFSKKDKILGQEIYNLLISLQHRGQDAFGFVSYSNKHLSRYTKMGLVGEGFEEGNFSLKAKIVVGHTRYTTSGKCIDEKGIQPIVDGNLAVAHNGHIANFNELKKELEHNGHTFKYTIDSEPILYLIKEKINEGIESAVKYCMEKLEGAYSVVMIVEDKLVVFRDPRGIRPLLFGKKDEEYYFASESSALDSVGVKEFEDVEGGSLIIIESDGKVIRKKLDKKIKRFCMFEYVYFARPDSVLEKKLVHRMRRKLGEQLFEEHPVKADVVIGIPDSARSAARGFSEKSGIALEEAILKNRYVTRTFIMPTQEKRAKAVKIKLNPIKELIEGKRVVLIDDSIVRGTTMKEIVKMIRGVGAKEVHLRITCPPIKAPCFYGVNMSTYNELIANNKSVDEIREYLGVDSLGYNSIEGLKKVLGKEICTGCLNGEYHSEYVKKMAKKIKGE